MIWEFMNLIKLQIAEMCFLLVIYIFYVRSRRLSLLVNRCFKLMLTISLIYLCFDICTVFTVNFAWDTSLNFIAHKFFYILMLLCVFSFSIYLEVSGNPKYKFNLKSIIFTVLYFIPLLFFLIGVIVSPIKCIRSERGAYSDGVAVYFLIGGILFYLIFIGFETHRYRNTLSTTKKNSFISVLIVWSVFLSVQVIDRYALVSGMALSVSVLILYFSCENPALFIDESTGANNSRAFGNFLNEECFGLGKKPFYTVCVIVDDADILISSIGLTKYELALGQVVERITNTVSGHLFRLSDSVLALKVYMDESILTCVSRNIERQLVEKFVVDDTTMMIKTHLLAIKCPEEASTVENILELANLSNNIGTEYIEMVEPQMLERIRRKSVLLGVVKDAVENDGFEVFYQPIYSVTNQCFVTAEALVRLKDTTTMGYVSPEEFVPVAEQNGLILKLGDVVFRTVCDAINEIRKLGIRLDCIEVNLSTLQMVNENVVDSFINVIKEKKLTPSSLNLEVTETAAVESACLFEKNMKTFKSFGCSFSMDDFGTGYSNLSSMADLSYDIVKIDKSLIWPAFDGNTKANLMLKRIIPMLKDMGVKIVAEGVETKEMVDFLSEHGVDYLQGFFYSKPIPKDQYIEFLKEHPAIINLGTKE